MEYLGGDIGKSSRGNNRRSSELQGPRPTPLKIHKDSHKIIKKPNINNHALQSQPRQPIIIYTVSPKIIHTTPSDFMNLVQRLTGSNSSSSNSSLITTTNNNNDDDGNMVSPPAIEKAKQHPNGEELLDIMGTTSMFHGILSPAPTSLSPVPAGFFSASDPTGVNLFHDLRNFMEAGFMPINNPTPSSSNNCLLSLSPHTPLSIDLFSQLFH